MSIFDKYDADSGSLLDREESLDYRHDTYDEQSGSEIESERKNVIPTGFAIVSLLVLITLGGRLFQIQIVQGQEKTSLARENSIRQVINPAPRGMILDTRGVWLARNTPSFRVQINPGDLPKDAKNRAAIYDRLAAVLRWSESVKTSYVSDIEKNRLHQVDPVVIEDEVDHDKALLFISQLEAVQAVVVVPQQVRQYNQPTDGLSHIIGYVGSANMQEVEQKGLKYGDQTGKSGLEDSYDNDLRGKDGVNQVVVDSKGKSLRKLNDKANDPHAGNNLVLSIDLKLQTVMANELRSGLEKAGIKSGVAIAMNPQNGEILGMVSIPAYDSNLFAHGISQADYQKLASDPLNPLFDRAVNGTFASGSTIKPFVAAIGLQEGVISENTRINTPPEITVGQWSFPNWQKIFIPNVDVKTAIAMSNDVFFYAVGGGYDKIGGLGISKLSKGLTWFGFGAPTGIDLPSEGVGLVPDSAWKKKTKGESWYIGDTYHLSIGQGDFLVTPLQLITALCAVANGGTLYQPHLVDHIVDADGNMVKTIDKQAERSNFISSNNIRIVREGMRQAVTNGSGRQLQSLPVTSGAKTGTAQFGASNENLHAWFEAFAPYDNPTFAIVVLGEKGPQTNEGNTTAEPIAKNIMEQYFSPDFNK